MDYRRGVAKADAASMDGIGRVDALVIDGADTMRLSEFWAGLLGTEITSLEGGGQYVDLAPNELTPVLRFQRVPERKGVKNRLHLDIEVVSLGPAVERVRSLGGSIVQETRTEYGVDFVIAADPESNEFCLIQPLQ